MKKKFVVINGIICGFLALVFIAANVMMALFFDWLTMYTNNMGLNLDSEESQAVQAEAKKFTEEIVEEGVVMLRNERNTLPLEKGGKVNLFGWTSSNIITGGSGGSGGTSGADIDLKKSLENAGFTVNEDLYNMYVNFGGDRSGDPTNPDSIYHSYTVNFVVPEPSVNDPKYYSDKLLTDAKNYSDTAILTLGRTSGEGLDLPEGYLSLTQEEKDLAKYLTENYKNVIVILNSNAAMEIGYLEEIDVEAIFYMPGTGNQGINAVGRILNGSVTPSGRLVDTFAYDHKSAPNYYYANRPGTMVYSDYQDVSDYKDKYFYVDYVEGIYVGYKYYETAAAENFIDYDATVQYPFGFGLSYTTFSQTVTDVKGNLNSDEIEITVEVENTGKTYSGKDVVEIYATAPYYDGGIEKAHVDLVGFEKTKLLAPGEKQTLTVTADPFEIASYDYNDANKDGKTGYVLEKGAYQLKLMKNSHDVIEVAKEFNLNNSIYIDEDPVTGAEISNLFDDVAGASETEPVKYLSRGDFKGTFPAAKECIPGTNPVGRKASQAVINSQTVAWEEEENVEPITTGAKNGVTIDDLKGLSFEDPVYKEKIELLLDQLTLEEMETLMCQCMFGTDPIESIGLDATTLIDGPQGLNGWISGIKGTSYPVETYIALTWNKEIAQRQGELFAREARSSNISGLFAPSTNIHRTPYCGRNFEYYSEDGFMSGVMAANVVYSAREEGVIMFVKHFALNDQETYRGEYFTSLYTWSNEQALREVFLKPFEIAVKQGKTLGIMTSFNRIGTKWTGSSKALCTDLLRTEWGFAGTTITDLYMSTNNEWWMTAEQGVRAGQDLWLTLKIFGGTGQKIDSSSPTTQKYMREACRHIINTFTQSTVSPAPLEANWFYHIALPIDIVAGIAIISYAVFIIIKARKK